MSVIEIDDQRRMILDAAGHLLVQGGPGCGKTTIALLKALERIGALEPEQRVLFLSFSRAAVRQIKDRMSGLFDRGTREFLEVRTFHAFFLDLVRAHGTTLNGRPASFVSPDREQQLKADYEGDWDERVVALAYEEGRYVFDMLAPAAADLLESYPRIRHLYSDTYPLIIVDEFQDTNLDQWRVVKALSAGSDVICLADPDQRIFEGFIKGVDDARLDQAIEVLAPEVFDMSSDNHRSPGGGLLDYANAVLRDDVSVSTPDSVKMNVYYPPVTCEVRTHHVLSVLPDMLRSRVDGVPTIAVLATENALVGRISEQISSDTRLVNGSILPAVDHELYWDAGLSAAAGYVVASIMEWPGLTSDRGVIQTLQAVADFYRVKFSGGVRGARAKTQVLEKAIIGVKEHKSVRSKTANLLLSAYADGIQFVGDPVLDWQTARARLNGSVELEEVFAKARLIRLFKATDALAWALIDAWDGRTAYVAAADVVRDVLAAEALSGPIEEPVSVNLMNMYKSKGREFDAVVIVEGVYSGRLLSGDWDEKRVRGNRRLLRVAITRARHLVVFIRPPDGAPLTGPIN